MSELSKLLGKPKAYQLGDLEINLRPLTLKDIDIILELAKEPEESKKALLMGELIKRTLKVAVPDATEQELEQISFTHFKALSEAIIELNSLNEK
jgi:hypothetical protein